MRHTLLRRLYLKKYDLKGSQPAVTALVVFFILCAVVKDGQLSTSYLGSTGLFTGIVAALFTVEIYHICYERKWYIKMPESVPPMVQDMFAALVPLVLNTIIAVAIANLSLTFGKVAFPQLIMNVLAPAVTGMDTLPALLIVMFFTQLLWFFGLHGPSITSAVWASFAIAYAAEKYCSLYGRTTCSTYFYFWIILLYIMCIRIWFNVRIKYFNDEIKGKIIEFSR